MVILKNNEFSPFQAIRNMNPVVTQQVALNNSLVTPEKRLKIERCNARIEFNKPQREETYQVTLEALKLSPCYPAFQITTKVLEIYMHQFWNTIKKIENSHAYNFKLDKKKCRVDTEEDFMYQADDREISSARKEHMPYPRFIKVIISHFISKDKTISMRNMINLHTIRDDSLLVAPKKARKFKKIASPSRKLSSVKEVELVKKAKRVKRPAKKSTATPTTGVVIRDTPGESILKKKAPAKADRGKGIELLLDVALLKDAQLKKALEKSRQETHKLQASGSSEGADFKSEGNSKDESDDVNDDDNDDDNANDDDSGNKDDDDEEQHDEEYESDDDNENVYEEEDVDLYKDVDVRSLGVEHEKERKGDEEMTDADQNVSQEKLYEHVIENAHVTLTSSQKTESFKQSSSVSSNFSSKFLILDNAPPVVDEVASMMNVKNRQEESSTQAPSFFIVPLTAILEISTAHTTTAPPIISMITPLPQLTTPSPHQQPFQLQP
ncbi:hypothetical protein Tco_1508998 [Tanacetum coccineum]